MPQISRPSASNGHDNGGRLNTWKEIAAYLGKGVRTVERWEVDLGLPVHRVGSGRGESVYALKGEIDAWLATVDRRARNGAADPNGRPEATQTDEGAPQTVGASPVVADNGSASANGGMVATRNRSPRLLLGASALVIVGAALWFLWLGPRAGRKPATGQATPASGGGPASWRMDGGQIAVDDAAGRQIFRTHFPFKLDANAYVTKPATGMYVALEDFDADGRRELLIVAFDNPYLARTLYCYNSDGSPRFQVTPDRTVRFGGVDHTPPFVPARFWLSTEPGGRRTIWFVAQHVLGPAVVMKLDPFGKLLSEYWGYGHVGIVQDATIAGRRVVLVGATNNESQGSSLAVLDYDNASATAPAATELFRCSNCPGGPPLHFFVFPLDDVSRVAGSARVYVNQILLHALGERTIVSTSSGGRIGADANPSEWGIFYTFDQAFNLTNAQFTEGYTGAHGRLQELGLLRHPLGDRDLREVSRVLRWDGTRLAPIKPRPKP